MSPDCLGSVKCSIFTWQYPAGKNQHCKIQILAEQTRELISRGCHGQQYCLQVHTHDDDDYNDDGDRVARDGVQIPSNRLPETYCTSMLWSIDTCQNKVSADQYHLITLRSCVFLSGLLAKCWFSITSQVHVRLACWRQGWVVWKRVEANPRLKIN